MTNERLIILQMISALTDRIEVLESKAGLVSSEEQKVRDGLRNIEKHLGRIVSKETQYA